MRQRILTKDNLEAAVGLAIILTVLFHAPTVIHWAIEVGVKIGGAV